VSCCKRESAQCLDGLAHVGDVGDDQRFGLRITEWRTGSRCLIFASPSASATRANDPGLSFAGMHNTFRFAHVKPSATATRCALWQPCRRRYGQCYTQIRRMRRWRARLPLPWQGRWQLRRACRRDSEERWKVSVCVVMVTSICGVMRCARAQSVNEQARSSSGLAYWLFSMSSGFLRRG